MPSNIVNKSSGGRSGGPRYVRRSCASKFSGSTSRLLSPSSLLRLLFPPDAANMESIVNSAFKISLESFVFMGSSIDCDDDTDVDGGADELAGGDIAGGASGERTRVGGPLCGPRWHGASFLLVEVFGTLC